MYGWSFFTFTMIIAQKAIYINTQITQYIYIDID